MWSYSAASAQKRSRSLAEEWREEECECGERWQNIALVCFAEEMRGPAFLGQHAPPLPSLRVSFLRVLPPVSPLWTVCAAIHSSSSLTSISVNRTSKACESDGEWQCLHWYAGGHVCSKVFDWGRRLSVCQDLKPLFSQISDLSPPPRLCHSTFSFSLLSLLKWSCVTTPALWESVGKYSYLLNLAESRFNIVYFKITEMQELNTWVHFCVLFLTKVFKWFGSYSVVV